MTTEPFARFGLHPDLVQTVFELGFTEPTAIQHAAIPLLLSGRDLIGQAQTPAPERPPPLACPCCIGSSPGKRASRPWC